uniref:Putative secreted protein n=1 Tax=Anopheles darlingi TaxID=43151 RepID=A0A2M4DIG7_ANODA
MLEMLPVPLAVPVLLTVAVIAVPPPNCCRYVCTSASLDGHSALIVLAPSGQLFKACCAFMASSLEL